MRVAFTILGLGALAIIALVLLTWDSMREPMIAKNETRNDGPLFVMGSIPYWDQPRAANLFKEHAEKMDAVSLFWYRLNAEGEIVLFDYAKEDMSLVQFAREQGVKTFALIANLPDDGEWDSDRVQNVIESPEVRAEHISEIIALLEQKGFDGVNIDYEFLEDSQTANYTAFVNELGAALHERGKMLVVAIHAQTRGSETRGQDIRSFTGADYLGYMTYDQHWETSDPGANAEIGWTREVLTYAARSGVPMRKILLGVPLDGYDWGEEDGEWQEASGVDFLSATALASQLNVPIEYDSNVEAPHITYERDGNTHEVWFEDLRSFQAKYDLAKEFGVGGLLLWKFGGEDERIYDAINEQPTK